MQTWKLPDEAKFEVTHVINKLMCKNHVCNKSANEQF